MHLANVSLHGWQEMQQLRAKDFEGVVYYIVNMRDRMLILHDQEFGIELFHEGMIVLTVLGQIQTIEIWIPWVADTYSANMRAIMRPRSMA